MHVRTLCAHCLCAHARVVRVQQLHEHAFSIVHRQRFWLYGAAKSMKLVCWWPAGNDLPTPVQKLHSRHNHWCSSVKLITCSSR